MNISIDTESNYTGGGYFCDYDDCNAIFSKKKKFTAHLLKHTGKRPFKCNEPNCQKTYTNSSHLNRHKLSHKGKNEELPKKCPHEGCHQQLANAFSLKKHCARMHDPNRYLCEKCRKGFHKKHLLKKHMYEHMGADSPATCDICKLTFSTKVDCNRHKRTHTKYTCKCLQVFERWSILLKHRKTCDSMKIKCTDCGKSFTNNCRLKLHLKVHGEERDVFECTYDGCPRYYFYKRNLQQHINCYHLNLLPPKKYVCSYDDCKKPFGRKSNLNNHLLKMHVNGPKPPLKGKLRKPRKDIGSKKRSTAAKLSGLIIPLRIEKAVVDGKNLDVILENENGEQFTTSENRESNSYSI